MLKEKSILKTEVKIKKIEVKKEVKEQEAVWDGCLCMGPSKK